MEKDEKKEKQKKDTNKKEQKPLESKTDTKETTKTTTSEEKPQKEKKKSSKKPLIIIVIALIIGLVCGLVYSIGFAPTTIDLSKCLDVEYDGYNGHATATVELNEDTIKDKIKDSSTARRFIKKLELEVEDNTDLSNGDEIKVKADIKSSFLKENKLKIKDKTVTIKVEGLEDANVIDLSKYIELELDGYNGHATATAKLKDSLEDVLGKKLYRSFKSNVRLIVDDEEISNDKEVKVSIEIPDSWLEENGVELKSKTAKVKATGLEDAKEIDVFKDIDINISGMSPNLQLSVTSKSTDEFIKTVEFTADKTTGISNGETITITATSWDEDMAKEKKYVLKSKTMPYTVKSQAAYISKVSEITAAAKTNLKSNFIQKAKSKATENYSYNSGNAKYLLNAYTDYQYVDKEDIDRDLSVGEPEIVSVYLLTKKADSNSKSLNIITGIIRVPFKSNTSGVTYNWYITIEATNASLKSDGSLSDNTNYDINVGSGKDEEEAYQQYINSKKEDYNVEKISL